MYERRKVMVKIPVSGVWWDVWEVDEKKGIEEVIMTFGTKRAAQRCANRLAADEHLGYKYKVEFRDHYLKNRVRRIEP